MAGPPMSICSIDSSWLAPDDHRGRERVEVDDHEVERLDAELGELVPVGLQPQVREDARVHARVQRLHATVEALREPGELLDLE